MALSKCLGFSRLSNPYSFIRAAHSVQPAPLQRKKPSWNRAVAEAEEVVGYPTSQLTLRCVLSEEVSTMVLGLRKLVGTNHPLLRTAKRLIYNGRANMQIRGLIVLLMSKLAGHPNGEPEFDDSYFEGSNVLADLKKPPGVSDKQRILAEITEMIYTAQMIHKSVVDLSFTDDSRMQDMEFGNKLSILSGDYVLAYASVGLTSLSSCEVLGLMSKAMQSFSQEEFIGNKDYLGNNFPTDNMTISDWTERSYFCGGMLTANSCQSALVLSSHKPHVQEWAYNFGKHLALGLQVYSELQPFTDLYNYPPGTPFDLLSAPAMFLLQKDPYVAEYIKSTIVPGHSICNLDFRKIFDRIIESDALEASKDLCQELTDKALEELAKFEENDAYVALENIIHSIRRD